MEIDVPRDRNGDFYVGYFDDYPEYPTQGENLKDEVINHTLLIILDIFVFLV